MSKHTINNITGNVSVWPIPMGRDYKGGWVNKVKIQFNLENKFEKYDPK